jgi:hypothetical protein
VAVTVWSLSVAFLLDPCSTLWIAGPKDHDCCSSGKLAFLAVKRGSRLDKTTPNGPRLLPVSDSRSNRSTWCDRRQHPGHNLRSAGDVPVIIVRVVTPGVSALSRPSSGRDV